jgi:hypothetical protein
MDLPSKLTGRNQYCLDEEGRSRTLNRGRAEKGEAQGGRFCQKVRDERRDGSKEWTRAKEI